MKRPVLLKTTNLLTTQPKVIYSKTRSAKRVRSRIYLIRIFKLKVKTKKTMIRFRAVRPRETESLAMLGTANRQVTSGWKEKWQIILKQITVVRCLQVWGYLGRTGNKLFINRVYQIGKNSKLFPKLRAVCWLHKLPSFVKSIIQTRNSIPKIRRLLLNHSQVFKCSLKRHRRVAMTEVMTCFNFNRISESLTTHKYHHITETISKNTKWKRWPKPKSK